MDPPAPSSDARYVYPLQQRAAGDTGDPRFPSEINTSSVCLVAPCACSYLAMESHTTGCSTAHEAVGQFPRAYGNLEQWGSLLGCLVFEKLSVTRKWDHPCRDVHLSDMFEALEHIVTQHIDTCCQICYRELLQFKDLSTKDLKKAAFGAIENVIAHIRWNHTKPWYCWVCCWAFGSKTKYHAHMREYPAHTSRIDIAGYCCEEMKFSDERLGRCTNKADLDDWELDCPVYRPLPNSNSFQAREDRASVGLHSQPSQAGGRDGPHPPMCVCRRMAPTYHPPESIMRSPTFCTHGCLAAGEPVQDDLWAVEVAFGLYSPPDLPNRLANVRLNDSSYNVDTLARKGKRYSMIPSPAFCIF